MGQMLSRFEVLVSPSTEKKTESTTQIFVSSSGIFCMSPIQALLKSKCFNMVHAQVGLQGTLSLSEAPGFHIRGIEGSFFIVLKFKSVRHICKSAFCLCFSLPDGETRS